MDIKIAEGVNYDYILVLSLNDESKLELKRVPINRSMSLINELLSYYEDSNYDIVDMFYALNRGTNTYKSYKYCLSHDYTDSYISEVKYPELDVPKYRKEEKEYRESLYHKAFKRLKYNHQDWTDSMLENESSRMIEEDCRKFNQKKKNAYINKCLNYIYSHDYNEAYSNIKESKSIISFSNESHGRFSYEHDVNDDLNVRISTNFCYGSASNFRVIITYKGIELLPYSIWVKYYYAGFSEVLHCTRSYRVLRSNWDVCMDFVIKFVNSAIDNPERFVKDVVMNEVQGMISGLREIYSLGKDYLNHLMELEPTEETDYVGIRNIRHCNTIDKKYYSVYPSEMYLVYRIGKISGALRFLENLKQLSTICEDVNSYIDELISMNISIYPELTEAIPPIITDVKNLERKLKNEEKQLKWLENRYEYLDNKLERLLSRCANYEDREDREKMFLKANPSYEKLKEQIRIQNNIVHQIQWDLSKRNEFLSDLRRFKILIEKNVELPQVA